MEDLKLSYYAFSKTSDLNDFISRYNITWDRIKGFSSTGNWHYMWYYKHFLAADEIPKFLNKHRLGFEDYHPVKEMSGVCILYYSETGELY